MGWFYFVGGVITSCFVYCLVGLSTTACAAPAASSQKARGAAKCWIINQRSLFTGDITIHATASRLKIYSPRRKIAVFFRAPDWNPVFYNFKTMRCFRSKLSNWGGIYGKGMEISSDNYFAEVPVKESKQPGEKVAGIDTTRFVYQSARKLGLKGQVLRMDCLVTRNLNLPDRQGQIINSLYKIPRKAAGFPMKVTYKDEKGFTRELDTLSCTFASLPGGTFDEPKGFASVAEEQFVLLDRGNINNMKEMVDTWGALGGMGR